MPLRSPSTRVGRAFAPGLLLVLGLAAGCVSPPRFTRWEALFPADGPPTGWTVRHWADVGQPPAQPADWRVQGGVLHGGLPRGTWLMSEAVYGDFELEFEFQLGARGNSGLALRSPPTGDPAFDGLELQMADLRYNPEATPAELTGGIYRAVAPRRQVYRPETWNHYRIRARGPRLQVWLNGERVQNLDLDAQTITVQRHDGSPALPLNQRPRRGHLGFQELSRDGDRVRIRNAWIRELD